MITDGDCCVPAKVIEAQNYGVLGIILINEHKQECEDDDSKAIDLLISADMVVIQIKLDLDEMKDDGLRFPINF